MRFPVMDLFPQSVAFVIGNETFRRCGQIVSVFEDPATGEVSNWGISLKWFRGIKPQATADDIKALTREGVERLYWQFFWEPASMAAIKLPMVAAKVFDAEVNMGHPHGIKLLQRALLVEQDGILGPRTVAACNADCDATLYAAFVRQAADRYQGIHDSQVKEYGQGVADKNLSQWLARLAKIPNVSIGVAA